MMQMRSYRTVLLAQTGIYSRDSSDGIVEYTTSVTGFIDKLIDDVVPTVTVSTYSNQKPWITGNIHTELKTVELPLSRSGTLTGTLIRNPAMPSDEPKNKQSIITGPA
jgi:hypothetical protein